METLTLTTAAIDLESARVVVIECRSVYGTMKAYPMNPVAFTLAKLTGQKTLTRHALNCAMELGFEIVSAADCDWRKVA